MTHEQRTRAAAELARGVAELLLQGDWEPAVIACRRWYERWCPRYDRSDVECRLVWIGNAVIQLDQIRGLTELPEGHHDRITPGQVPIRFRDYVTWHWREIADTYRRHCLRIDETPAAESRVAEIVARVEKRRAQPAGATS